MGNLRHPQSLGIRQQLSLSAGQFLSVNGDQLQVNIGNGLDDDGSGNIEIPLDAIQTDELDLSITPVWTGNHTFDVGLDLGGDIDMQSVNSIVNLPAPIDDNDAARKSYVDGVIEGLSIKDSSRVATDGTNIDLTSAADPNPIDSVTLNDGDRILLKDQTDGTENGIYNAVTATDPTTWTRTTDFDEDSEVTSGSFTFIEEGTINGSSSYIVITDDPIVVGTDVIEWSQFSSAGQFTAGDGISLSGKEFSINEAFAFAFTSEIDFGAGLDTQGDITDGSQIIWDTSAKEIPDSAMGNIDNSTLTNSSITLNGGDGLKNGSTASLGGSFNLDIEPADFAGSFLSDDGAENLRVDIGFGVEDDGSGNIRVDEDAAFDFTSRIGFEGDLAALGDGTKVFYGADLDMSSRYDAGEDELKWRDETNSSDRMSLARTTGDLTISGTLDETSSP